MKKEKKLASRSDELRDEGAGVKKGKENKLIICLFGNPSTGKSTLLRSLMHDIIDDSKVSICDADGFCSRDQRVVAWYKIGRKQGVVSVCTAGDSTGIIEANIKFFEKYISCWDVWFSQSDVSAKKRIKKETEKLGLKKMPRILITAAHKPLEVYKGLREVLKGYKVLNIPIAVDVWKFHKGGAISNGGTAEWLFSQRTIAESILRCLRYMLINGEIPQPFSKEAKYGVQLMQKGKELAIALASTKK